MSVIVRNMEMPISCAECPIGGSMRCALIPGVPAWCAEYDQCVEEKKLHSQCPLIPVPPHGRLIDGDAYEALIRGLGNREYRRENGTICDAIKFLHPYYAPTIIPADETTKKDGGQDDV